MWTAVSSLYAPSIRTGPAGTWATATYYDPIADTTSAPLPIKDGQVVDDSTQNIRRTLTLSLPPLQSSYDLIASPGGLVTVTKTRRYVDLTMDVVPMGVFVVDQDSMDYSPGGSLQLTCPDLWVRVQRAGFAPGAGVSVPSNMVWQEIKRLVEGAFLGDFPGWSQIDHSATTLVGNVVYDTGNLSDRESAVVNMARGSSVEVFPDRNGLFVLRPVPMLTDASTPVTTIDASRTGVLVGAVKSRDRSVIRNAIVVSSSASDIYLTPVVVANTKAGDPLSTTGPLGYVPDYFVSPTVRTNAQALAAGQALLPKRLGPDSTMALTAICDDRLDSGDVISVVLPRTTAGDAIQRELHIADSVTTPLLPSGDQSLQTRSTRPASEDGES